MKYLILLILLFVIYGSLQLSLDHFNSVRVCPKLIGKPACYIVLLLFSVGLIGHLISFPFNKLVYFISIGIIASIALKGSISELSGIVVCPRSSNGVPMCYYSLVISSALLLLKIIEGYFIKTS